MGRGATQLVFGFALLGLTLLGLAWLCLALLGITKAEYQEINSLLASYVIFKAYYTNAYLSCVDTVESLHL